MGEAEPLWSFRSRAEPASPSATRRADVKAENQLKPEKFVCGEKKERASSWPLSPSGPVATAGPWLRLASLELSGLAPPPSGSPWAGSGPALPPLPGGRAQGGEKGGKET